MTPLAVMEKLKWSGSLVSAVPLSFLAPEPDPDPELESDPEPDVMVVVSDS